VTGSLPKQFFAGGAGASQGSGTKAVTFHGVAGNKVKQIHSGSPNITYDGINADAGGAQLAGSDGAVFENGGGDNDVFRNGSIGNVVDQKGALVDGSNVLIENTSFHDVHLRTSGVHTECLYAIVVPSLILRNNTFANCAIMDILFEYGSWWSPLPPPYGNVTITGSHFGPAVDTPNGISLYIGHTGDNPAPGHLFGWKISGNQFDQGIAVGPQDDGNNTFCGNTGSVDTGWQKPC
jgi:hypothetical protein